MLHFKHRFTAFSSSEGFTRNLSLSFDCLLIHRVNNLKYFIKINTINHYTALLEMFFCSTLTLNYCCKDLNFTSGGDFSYYMNYNARLGGSNREQAYL